MGYALAAAKVTSTAFVFCSVYLLARLRTRRNDPADITGSKETSKSQVSLDDNPADSFTCPLDSSTSMGSRQLLAQGRHYLSYGWHWVTRIFYTGASDSTNFVSSNLDIELAQHFSAQELNAYLDLVSNLAEHANIDPAVRSLLTHGSRLRLTRSKDSPSKMLSSLLTALASFTKNDLFLKRLLAVDQFHQLLDRITNDVARALPNQSDATAYPTSPQLCTLHGTTNTQSLPDQMPANDGPSASADRQQPEVRPTVSSTVDEYPFHLLLVQLLANISRHSTSTLLLDTPAVQRLLTFWSQSPSLHLILLSQKVRQNFHAHKHAGDPSVIYTPHVYRLDRAESTEDERTPEYDIIFVHGMRGSVFFTWRQNDATLVSQVPDANEYTKCWPRDWLAREFPTARILAIDASLNPFVWDPICPIDKLKRTLDTRAKNILPQLQAAGVGRRPVIWVTHSAGGILVKELLRVSVKPEQFATAGDAVSSSADAPTDIASNRPITTERPESSQSIREHVTWFSDCITEDLDLSKESPTVHLEGLHDIPPFTPPSASSSLLDQRSSSTGCIERHLQENVDCDATGELVTSDLIQLTRGIVFMSAPHRGNQSLMGLYRRPLRWTLTPEAIQLEQNSAFLLNLHAWFRRLAARQPIRVLTMVETRGTPVNRFWSVLLVPEDKQDGQMGEIVHIDSDHMYISKPRDPTDPAYSHIVKFIRQVQSEHQPEDDSAEISRIPLKQAL